MLSTWDAPDTDGMKGVAQRLGMQYAGDTSNHGYQEALGDEALPQIDILRESNSFMRDLIYGRFEGCNTQLFHFTLASYEPEPTATKRSCCLITFNSDFPKIVIGPHTRMSKLSLGRNRKWLKFAGDSFRNTFHVDAPSNEVAEQFLSSDLTTYLMSTRPDLRLTLQGGALLAHVPQLGDDDWDNFLAMVVGFQARLPAEVWSEYSLFSF